MQTRVALPALRVRLLEMDAMHSSTVELLEMFRKTASEVVEKPFANVQEATVISELGLDSLAMLEVVGSMERQLKIQIPDDQLAGIHTVRDLLDVVAKRQQVAALAK
jgi:acyl carrier protein